MINMYDFMIRDSLVLITLFYYFFAWLWASPFKKNEIMPIVGHTFVYVNKV